ncbi:MAG: hypothetical protein CMP51_06305 [Flavobacteriales bacterium]|nr:hypothetical protein [Flavobacteriales bacterium]
MKKIFIIFVCSLMCLNNSYSQSIQNISITSPILCHGELADINILINQTSPPTILKLVVGYYPFPGVFVPITSTNNTTVASINVPGLSAQIYTIRLVDSLLYYPTNGFGDPADPNAIYDVDSIVITEPPPINVVESSQNASSLVVADGSINLAISGGVGFSSSPCIWTGPNNFFSNNLNINNLYAGVYIYTVIDSNGCVFSDTVEVNAIQLCSYGNVTSFPTICNGDANGLINVDSVFGLPPFNYFLEIQDSLSQNWYPVTNLTIYDTFVVFNNLFAGIYRYTLSDSIGCNLTSPNISVQNPTPITTNNTVTNSINNSSCDGSISIIVNGGFAPFSHSWSGPNNFSSLSPNLNNLCPGLYCDSIVDNNGCSEIICEIIDIEPPCMPELEISNVFCNQDSSGIAIVTKTDNAYPLFIWKNVFGDTISMDTFALNLPAGSYTFNAYSLGLPNSCPDTTIVFDILDSEIDLVSFNGNVICDGDSTFFVADPVNLDSNFSYQILLENEFILVGDSSSYYPPGTYSYTVLVDTGSGFLTCFDSDQIEVFVNDLSIDSLTIVNEICVNSLGSILVSASSSNLPLSYSINSSTQLSSLFNNLTNNFYDISVEDNLSCNVSIDSVYVDISSSIEILIDSAMETCALNDGYINLILDGGFGFYQFSLDSGVTFSSSFNTDTILIDSLSKGQYSIIIRDDSLCVSEMQNIFLNRTPNPKIDSVLVTNESCCGFDATISVFVNPSNNLLYSLDSFNNNQSNNIFDSLSRGFYNVLVIDSNDCTANTLVTIIADSLPQINLTVGATDVVCYGDSNGTFKVYYPDNCYSYDLYRYTFLSPQILLDTGTYFNNLISGYYGVIATSNSGACIDSSFIRFIDEPASLSYDSLLIQDVTCILDDSCNGSVAIFSQISGGVSPYFYYLKELDNNIPIGLNSTTDTFELLCPGLYEMQIIDGNACIDIDTININDLSLKIDSFVVENVSCYNGSDGLIEVFSSGGLGNYVYVWSNADTTKIIDSLNRDFYTVNVYDSTLCMVFDSVFVAQPDTLQFKILENGKKPETCMGVSYDGEIYLEITGGTPPYNYIWNSFSSISGNTGFGFGDTIFNLSYDTIAIDVTDANYCSGSPTWGTVNVTIVDALNADNPLSIDTIYVTSDPLCYGGQSGYIDIELDGGDIPVYYSIDSGFTYVSTDSFVSLSSGKYYIYVMDTYGCLDSAVVDIHQSDKLEVIYDSIKHVSCYEGNDGLISISVIGGFPPFEYMWIPSMNDSSFINELSAVPHIVRVTDSNGCTLLDTIILHELTDPIQTQTNVISEVSCFNGSDGSITTVPIGGYPNYTYIWINSLGDTVSYNQSPVDLPSDNYLVFVSDSFSCGPASDSIFLSQSAKLEIDVINVIDNTCHGERFGEMQFSFSGGIPSYNIFVMENGNIYSSSTALIDNLPSGLYQVWAVDNKSCISDTLNGIKLGEPGKIEVNNLVSDLNCYQSYDGNMQISILGGLSPYNVNIYHENSLLENQFVNQSELFEIYNLDIGTYLIGVTDYNNCYNDSLFYVLQPEEIIADFDSNLEFGRKPLRFSASNASIGGHVFYWDFDNDSLLTTFYLQNVDMEFYDQGQYDIMLIAHDTLLGNQCNDTLVKSINVEGYNVYNVFTPNNDGINDIFNFNEWMINGIYVEIFNRWGEKIYHWEDVDYGWDGKGYSGQKMEEGVYFYRMTATGVDGAHFEENGSITLLR